MHHVAPARFAVSICLALAVLIGPATHQALAQDDEARVLQVTTESEQAEAHFWAGVDDVENVFLSRSAMHFEQALELDPDFGMAQFMHARSAPGMGRAERLEKMAAAMAVLANASAGELAFASAIREQFAGNAREARAMYAAAARISPDDPHVAFRRAAFTGAGGSADRLRALTNVREAHPTFAASANTLAYLQWNMGDQARARQNVARYMELAGSHPNSHDSYAELFQFSGMIEEAIAHYNMALELDETYTAGYTGLAEAYMLAGDGDMARDALERAAPHSTTNGLNNLGRAVANTYLMEGDTRRAEEALQEAAQKLEAINNNGLTAQAHRELAVLAALGGDAAMAHGHLEKALEFQDANAAQHAMAAITHGLMGHAGPAARAAAAFEEATGPNNTFAATLTGYAQLVGGDAEGARRSLVKSGLRGPWEKAFMALTEKALGNEDEAERWEQAVWAHNQHTAFNLGVAFSRLIVSD